jgi:hypothetical protein
MRGSTAPKQKIVWSAEFLCITDKTTLGAADSDLVGYCLKIALLVDVNLAKRARSPDLGDVKYAWLTSETPSLKHCCPRNPSRSPDVQKALKRVGSFITLFGAGSTFTHVTACLLAKSSRLQQFRILHCCFDCYRVERTSSRAGFPPAADQRLFTAHDENGVNKDKLAAQNQVMEAVMKPGLVN